LFKNELSITIPTAVPSYSPFCPILPLPKASSVPNGFPLPPLINDKFERDFTAFSRIQQSSEPESDKTEEEDEYEVNYKD